VGRVVAGDRGPVGAQVRRTRIAAATRRDDRNDHVERSTGGPNPPQPSGYHFSVLPPSACGRCLSRSWRDQSICVELLREARVKDEAGPWHRTVVTASEGHVAADILSVTK
jgi:hypothetical protein